MGGGLVAAVRWAFPTRELDARAIMAGIEPGRPALTLTEP